MSKNLLLAVSRKDRRDLLDALDALLKHGPVPSAHNPMAQFPPAAWNRAQELRNRVANVRSLEELEEEANGVLVSKSGQKPEPWSRVTLPVMDQSMAQSVEEKVSEAMKSLQEEIDRISLQRHKSGLGGHTTTYSPLRDSGSLLSPTGTASTITFPPPPVPKGIKVVTHWSPLRNEDVYTFIDDTGNSSHVAIQRGTQLTPQLLQKGLDALATAKIET